MPQGGPSDADRMAAELLARAEGLEQELARVILELDEDALARLAQAALEIGFTAEEVEALFARSISRHLETAYDLFAADTAERYGLTPAYAAAQDEAQHAIGALLADLGAEGVKVVERLVAQARREGWGVDPLARAIRDQIVLTEQQNGWVANYARKLRRDQKTALRNKLRDRRADRRLRRDEPLTEREIESLTSRYRERVRRYRARFIARHELLKASNGASLASWQASERAGALPDDARKFWWNMHDRKVRHSHVEIPELNAEGVPLDQPFESPLGPIRYPLDPDATAENTLGCRCLLLFGRAGAKF